MKTILLAFSILLAFPLFGQNDPNSGWIETLNFDSPYWDTFHVKLQIDTINSNNIWQIGSPQKTLFNQAVSLPNVIITDTVNTYPVNDTSYFIINYSSYNCPLIQGSYYSDTDSLNDYGMIEISLDNGQTWIDALNDSTLTQSNKPNLTGNSGGWQHFFIDFWNHTQTSWQLDTFLVKFTFISDSIDAQHEGLMFDDLGFCILINTQNIKYQNNLTVFPNPTSDLLNFQFDEPIDNSEIRIYSTIGQLVGQTASPLPQNKAQFNVSDWHSGIYFYRVYVEGRLVKQGQVLIIE